MDFKQFIRSKQVMRYLDRPNITSVGIGYKEKGGKRTGEIAIQFTVDQKHTLEALESLDTPLIPESFEIDGEMIKTDVIERTYQPSYRILLERGSPSRKARQDPVVPGISVAHVDETAGTLGGIVYDMETGTPYILSNWHILHGPMGAVGDTIVQPGPFDDNATDRNKIGELIRSHLGLAGDCAICSISGRGYSSRILELEATPRQIGEVELDDRVIKSGRTTEVTYGIVRRIEVTANINYGEGVGERKIGCFEIGPDPDCPAPNNEISMGGDSGSLWLIRDEAGDPTEIVVGLHFAGESKYNPNEYALACNIRSVMRKLNILFVPPAEDRARRMERFRLGYDPGFLGAYRIPHPELDGQLAQTALTVNGLTVVPYVHFSLTMHKGRRMAIYTAHNVDGLSMKKASRRGVDWQIDDRIDSAYQVGNEAYVNNPWDRGHLVRRAAVLWGMLAEARQANRDSFHYTNAAPQHKNFNQDEWVHLEDWVLDHASEANYRLCVFTGPVFSPQDQKYRGIRIPAAFWKIITMQKSDGSLSVTAFLMNQYELLTDRDGRKFIDLTLYQVSVETIEYLTGLRFPELRQDQPEAIMEALVVPEGVVPEPWPTVVDPEDISV